ncbi:MAG: APC family permease [Acidobacteriaceae bacterium]|nr:APC family permease [Acidobacteriaceae bacterium]
MSILDVVLGRPLATSEERAEQIGALQGVPVFGLDALGSAAYGPEAALTLLIPLGVAGLSYILPLTFSIVVLLIVVYFSYRQTIAAYPKGGGSYTVAHQNLGTFAGLMAGAALLIDYTLDAAVGISAGIGALTSAVPSLHSQTLWLCLAALALLTTVNLRGNRETGLVFTLPTYLFLLCMGVQIGVGVFRLITQAGHPAPIVPPPSAPTAVTAFSAWLLLKSFASGCTALTGVEAVSNGVRAFREPTVKCARWTLSIIIAALAVMLIGIALLVHSYHIVATDPNGNHYQSVLSMMFGAVLGRGWFYYVSIASVLLVLVFSANTAFADFPRVCRVLAEDGFLPLSFANRGRRLVYSEGIVVLSIVTAGLLAGFGGITDRLIPLFAVGAFLAFTMSQAGMVAHWRRAGGRGARRSMLVNGLGALATGVTVLVIIVAKFTEGAWITVIAIPALLILMYRVRSHYRCLEQEIAVSSPLEPVNILPPIVVITVQSWNRITKEAVQFAMSLTRDIKVVHAAEDSAGNEFPQQWEELVERPAKQANLPVPELVAIESPYRYIVSPIVNYVVGLSSEHPNRRIVAVVPELVEKRWYQYFLHTQRAALLKARLLLEGNDRISVLNVPWYLKSG